MSTDHGDAGNLAADLARGIDPDRLSQDSLSTEALRSQDSQGPTPLEASCVRDSYAAIAVAGDEATSEDAETLKSLHVGARAAAEAARLANEIGAGAGAALRGAARAWYPHAVEGQEDVWRALLRAFSESCELAERVDARTIVDGVAAGREAIEGDETPTGRAAIAFADELAARDAAGDSLPVAWAAAADRTRQDAPDPVFLVVVDAVTGVLHQRDAAAEPAEA